MPLPSMINGQFGIKKLEEYLLRDQLKSSIHVLESDEIGIIFVKEDISVSICPKSLKNSLRDFIKGNPAAMACFRYGISLDDFQEFLLLLLKKATAKPEKEIKASDEETLNRLVVNISQDCNLRCRYCYAGGGDYGSEPSLMNETTAKAVLDTFYRMFDHIENIQFFGGEPFLNPRLIAFICRYLKERNQRGILKNLPNFGVVTNGTILSKEIIHLLKEFQIGVTISLDGPEYIQDNLRGRGTYRSVQRFIQALDNNGIDFGFESTFTSAHLDAGITLNTMMDFFSFNYNCSEIHIPPVALCPESPLALDRVSESQVYRSAIEYSTENLLHGKATSISFATRLIDAYTECRPIRLYCPAGFATLSVDTQGNVFPCFMFTGIDDFRFGNVFDPVFPDRSKTKPIIRRLRGNEKSKNPDCLTCWAFPFCSGCIGADYFKNEGKLKKTNCEVMKSMIEGFLSKIASSQGGMEEKPKRMITEKGGDRIGEAVF
jgi:uncharacterized protein